MRCALYDCLNVALTVVLVLLLLLLVLHAMNQFRGARSFAQDLCAWGPLLRPTANVTDLLVDTFCDTTDDPSFVLDETGIYRRLEPWCVRTCNGMT